jgi:SNF2 family DNA or RNA helicase
MKYKPWPYQQHAIDWIIDHPACGLLLDMGLGKTVVTLTAIDQMLHDSFEISKVLVIAPLRVAQDTWSRESAKWDHLQGMRIAKILGSEKERLQGARTPADIWIINRENVEWLVKLFGAKWPYDTVIIDELSSFKSSKSIRFRSLRKVRPFIKRIIGLTGTPTPNGLLDLWPQIYLLDQGERLGKTITGYRERYFIPDKRNQVQVFSWKPREESESTIYSKISDLCISMNATDYLDVPDRIDVTEPVTLGKEARKAYQQMEDDGLLPLIGADITTGAAVAIVRKLLQIANGAAYDDNGVAREIHTHKLDKLEDIIEAANGQPILIFYTFKHDLARIQARFGAKHLQTAQDIADWNAGKIPLLAAHPASAGHGLNLQDGGHQIVWFGLPWSLELYQQANARLHRQGQQHPVIIHHLIAEDTMDEQVLQVLSGKAKEQDALLDAVKARIEHRREQ